MFSRIRYRFQVLGIIALLIAAFGAQAAFADAIPTDGSWTEFLFGVANTPSAAAVACGGCVGTTNPVAAVGVSPPWTFSGPATLDVLDLFIAGDQFAVYDNAVLLGDTSVPTNTGYAACSNDIGCALADANYSQGIWSLGAGGHAITIDVIQNAVTSPTGGAAVLEATSVPEPSSLLLLGIGLLGLGGTVRRKFFS